MKSALPLLFMGLMVSLFSCRTNSSDQQKEPSDKPLKVTFSLSEVWATDTLLRTPESALYDESRDVIYVSNVNLNPRQKDGNGFISKVSTTGEILDLYWVDGLSSPKGMGLYGNILYTTDIDEIVSIDVEKGEIINKIALEKAGMFNDISVDASGKVYISDMDSSRIYVLEDNRLSLFKEGDLNLPNGVYVEEDRLYIGEVGINTLSVYAFSSGEKTALTGEMGRPDGIVPATVPGYYFVSDWQGEVFVVNPAGEKTSLLNTKAAEINAADIWLIPSENLLLVPTFFGNRLVAYQVNISEEGE
ncbi:MAG: gluconolaconase [Bacteroidia bacterium]|nr:gluconolaconase [Bacteroidia bacterium]